MVQTAISEIKLVSDGSLLGFDLFVWLKMWGKISGLLH